MDLYLGQVATGLVKPHLEYQWRPVTSGDPQGWTVGPVLFNVFVSNMDSGTECTLSQFANTTKLCGMADMLERRDAIQKDLDRP
ncbi:rna-directed dna polymerase from mobile element jockey-like [Limosa lapponica baueri]|uniref:Rna-directed dna polymerase from mobile element jockey-like n=1 Tax=Limosa lapponica baueri TaxID=1758121 RepID=A0A2I0UPC7_LIMLA|nr:rna-directed dna polymerase from mobile element jockey-like [Limosa lapponica baueri]